MKKIDTDELFDLLNITQNAQQVLAHSNDHDSKKIATDVLAHVRKRVKSIRKGEDK